VGYLAPAAFWQAAPVLAGGSAVVVAAAGGAGGHLVARRGRRLQNSSRLLTGDDAGSEWLLALAVHIGQIAVGSRTTPSRWPTIPAGTAWIRSRCA
jgi:hypothetical protein